MVAWADIETGTWGGYTSTLRTLSDEDAERLANEDLSDSEIRDMAQTGLPLVPALVAGEVLVFEPHTADWNELVHHIAYAQEAGRKISISQRHNSISVKVGEGMWSPPLR